jgi:prepilin-type N-terminal cleavage/methylation domain-containing protein
MNRCGPEFGNDSGGEAGFTLVEMLVALSIFSMLVAVLMAGFSQGLLLWERGNTKSSHWLSIQHRHELLRQLFINARLADYRGKRGISHPHFLGDRNQLEFTTRAPILDLGGRIRPVRIVIERGENGRSDFYYQEAGRHHDQGRGIGWNGDRRVPLLEDILNPEWRYLAPAFPLPPDLYIAELNREDKLRYRENPEWLDWYDSSILWRSPLMVELSFTDDVGIEHIWSFRVPGETDAWSLMGQLDEYQ